MAVSAFIAGAASVTGASIVQGLFAYLLERRRSTDTREAAAADQGREARTAYRMLVAEMIHNHSVLRTCLDHNAWWEAPLAPKTSDWLAYRETVARHLDVKGLFSDIAIAYGALELLIGLKPMFQAIAVEDPSRTQESINALRTAIVDQLSRLEPCKDRLQLLAD